MVTEAKKKAHYINNKDFSHAVVDYVTSANDRKEKGNPVLMVTDIFATCFKRLQKD